MLLLLLLLMLILNCKQTLTYICNTVTFYIAKRFKLPFLISGHAMRLTYFVSPYELLDKDKGLQPLTTELLMTGKPSASSGLASLVAPSHTPIGHSATVLLEGSVPNKLQLSPILSGGPRSGKR